MEDWSDRYNGDADVPQISLCRGPEPLNHIWGVNTAGKVVYARASSMLQYSYDGNLNKPAPCSNPTYPGPILAVQQGTANTAFQFRNAVGRFHPMNFAVDPRLYSASGVTKNQITYNPATASTSDTTSTNAVPAVVHVHGAVVASEFDGVPYFTLTKTGDTLLHKFYGISNPAALLLYHDHAWGFTRLTVYAGGISGFLVKENPALYSNQPKPTKKCPTSPTDTCGIPEISWVDVNPYDITQKKLPNWADLQDIPLIISDRALVAPTGRTSTSVFAELGYPVGQQNGCNSCTPPTVTPNLDPSNAFCTSPTNGVCPATYNATTSYCGRWSPEFFGPNNIVNGQVTPVLKVPPAWYRFRLANGANTRAYTLNITADSAATTPYNLLASNLCYKIATEAGYTLYPLSVGSPLVMLPAERVELMCNFGVFTAAANYTVWNQDPNPAGNPGQPEVMKIWIQPGMKLNVNTTVVATRPVTQVVPGKRLATIPPLSTLYAAQALANQTEKHVMLMERFATNLANGVNCSQGLAVSECRDASNKPQAPTGANNAAWGVPDNCLKSNGMPRNMFSDGEPLTCKEGLIEKWIWYNPTFDVHPWHWHLNHVQCGNENELKETVAIPNSASATTSVLTCYVACADAQYILDSGEEWFKTTPGNAAKALAAGIAKGYNPNTGPAGGPAEKVGTCSSTTTTYSPWDYVTHCHILEHEEYDMMAKYRILPKSCANNY